MGNSNSSGIYIGNRIIQRISGPISMYYLKPSVERFLEAKKDGLNLPLILLFGDLHRSSDMACPNCTCNENELCCLDLSNTKFLKELDIIAEKYPIDFSTESAPYFFIEEMRHRIMDRGFLFQKLIYETTQYCHNRPLRVKHNYESKCPTKYVRWQHVDSRFMVHTIEGYMLLPLIEWLKLQIEIHNKRYNNISKEVFPHTLGDLKLYEKKEKNKINNKIKGIHVTNIDIKLREDGLRFIKIFLKLLFEPYKNDKEQNENLNKIIDIYFEFIENHGLKRESVLYKQIEKQTFPKMKSIKFWKDLYKETILNDSTLLLYMNKVHEGLYNMYNSNEISIIIKWIMDGMTYEKNEIGNEFYFSDEFDFVFRDLIKRIMNFVIIYEGITLDIYYLARMFKKPENNIPPVLSIGYFGNMHTTRIKDILESKLFGYNIEYNSKADIDSKDNFFGDKEIRCRVINKKISLTTDLELFTQLRFKNNISNLNLYKKSIQIEQSLRNRNRNRNKNNKNNKTIKRNNNNIKRNNM